MPDQILLHHIFLAHLNVELKELNTFLIFFETHNHKIETIVPADQKMVREALTPRWCT